MAAESKAYPEDGRTYYLKGVAVSKSVWVAFMTQKQQEAREKRAPCIFVHTDGRPCKAIANKTGFCVAHRPKMLKAIREGKFNPEYTLDQFVMGVEVILNLYKQGAELRPNNIAAIKDLLENMVKLWDKVDSVRYSMTRIAEMAHEKEMIKLKQEYEKVKNGCEQVSHKMKMEQEQLLHDLKMQERKIMAQLDAARIEGRATVK